MYYYLFILNFKDIPGWGRVSEICNTGKRQSPIEINLEKAKFSKDMVEKPIVFGNGYLSPLFSTQRDGLCGSLKNTGHSIQWTLAMDNNTNTNLQFPKITGFQFGKDSYLLEQFHFHWGDSSDGGRCQGAEHLLDYKSSPMELHLVHFNSKFASVAEAQDEKSGLAVVAFQFEPTMEDDADDPFQVDYAGWLVDKISDGTLGPAGSTVELCLSSLAQVVPFQLIERASNASVYTYQGSLTTPNCYESVTWTLFQNRIKLPQWQIDTIRNGLVLQTLDGMPMVNNYRPIQMTNGRPIWTNVKNAATATTFTTGIFVSLLISLVFSLSSLSSWLF